MLPIENQIVVVVDKFRVCYSNNEKSLTDWRGTYLIDQIKYLLEVRLLDIISDGKHGVSLGNHIGRKIMIKIIISHTQVYTFNKGSLTEPGLLRPFPQRNCSSK